MARPVLEVADILRDLDLSLDLGDVLMRGARLLGDEGRMAEAARRYAMSQSWDAIMSGLRCRYQNLVEKDPARLVADHSGR